MLTFLCGVGHLEFEIHMKNSHFVKRYNQRFFMLVFNQFLGF